MTLVHTYRMTARKEREPALAEALTALSEAVKAIPGSNGALVLRDRRERGRFLFLELWQDEQSRKAAGAKLPKEVMGAIMASIEGPLEMADYERLAG
jgi:quinol monooxygenase YgiN